jgi:hypothetical protein
VTACVCLIIGICIMFLRPYLNHLMRKNTL